MVTPRKAVKCLSLVVIALCAFGVSNCCGLKAHHHRRLGPDLSQAHHEDDKELVNALGKSWVLRFGPQDGEPPAVLLLHELGGPTPEAVELAARLDREGYTVYLPVLFGRAGERSEGIFNLARRCLSHDFACLQESASPLAIELANRLLPAIAVRHSSIGVIGMCLTGNFPLVLVTHEKVRAAVLSQPSLPIVGKGRTGLSPHQLQAADKAMSKKGMAALYFRYSNDCLSPQARLAAFKAALPGRLEERVFSSCHLEHHAVLTDSLTETPEAWSCLLSYLAERLKGKPPLPGACISQSDINAQTSQCGGHVQ